MSVRPVLALLAASAFALAACSAGPAAPPTATVDRAAPVTLTWWTGQEADAQATLEKLAKEFSAAHPNVTIKVSPGAPSTDALLQKVQAGFAADTYPDVTYAFGSWAAALGDSGHALDVSSRITEPDVRWQEFDKVAQETASPGGKTIGFPAISDNLVVIYNPALFAKAGVPEPTPDWTWDQFRTAAKKISDPAVGTYGSAYSVVGSEDTTWHLWPLLWQNGGQVLSPDNKHALFNSPAGVKALTFLRDMAVGDKSLYLDQTDEKYGPLFKDGHVGMIISGPWQFYDLVQAKTPYKVVPLPGTGGNHQTISGVDIWALFDHGDANRAYWAFELGKWLTSAPIDVRWNLANGNQPLRSSEAGTPEFKDYVTQFPGADVVFANRVNATTPRPAVTAYPEMSREVGKAISQVLQGAAEPQAALDAAAKRADQALAGG
jgi:multiple sugar transport system substrate-binding protein